MSKISRIGFVIKPHAPGIEGILKDLLAYLRGKGVVCVLETVAAEMIGAPKGIPREKLPAKVDLVLVLGGDGTLLSVAHRAALADVPIMGVNLGRLGFLTEIPLDETRLTLDALLAGNTDIISARNLIAARFGRRVHNCLNDVVINKGAAARMIQIGIRIDGKEVAVLKADGLIVSTPTGSTAYSLSAGGPIIQPLVAAVVLSPICPHMLAFRPMVISERARISLKLLTDGEEVTLTLDGQRGTLLKKNDEVEIRRSDAVLRLVTSPRRNYFDLVKEKLGWAEYGGGRRN
ncbi:MAG: NAD(+)/NADH kinase [Candidatus Aminicenantales bacterium]